MTVFLIGNYPNDRQESMQRYARLMLSGLIDAGFKAELVVPQPFFGRLKDAGHGLGKWLGYLDKFLVFPLMLKRRLRKARKSSADFVVHICDHSNAFYTKHLHGVPHLVTCHDLLAIRSALGEIPENRTGRSGRVLQSMILEGLRNAQHVTCVSEATRSDLLRVSQLPPERISVIPNSLNHRYFPLPGEEAQKRIAQLMQKMGKSSQFPRGFILHVGGNQWYKNRMGVLRIYAELRRIMPEAPDLVMVGKPFADEMTAFVEKEKFSTWVTSIEQCDNDELQALYSSARLLLFPSLAEGFGWPLIEAQACGCPVASSNIEPLPEVAGGEALIHDPADEVGFARTLQEFLESGNRADLIQRGFVNAALYEPREMIAKYIARYELVIKESLSKSRGICCTSK